MKKTIIISFALILAMGVAAMPPRKRPAKKAKLYERIEPASWWAGMHDTKLQLMIYGENVGKCQVFVDDDELEIDRVERTSNPNYLFVYLDTEDAAAGIYEITLRSARKTETIQYELKERKEGSAERESFGTKDAVYLIMPDRFANGNKENDNVKGYIQGVVPGNLHQRQGGDIQGIIDHLDYIRDLGMTAIWTTPVLDDNDTLYSYHHYAVTDYYKVDPRFGTNDDFVKLVEECHKHGLKYIMDIVPNHVNPRHWWNNDLPDSTWYNWWKEGFVRTNYQIAVSTDPYASDADRNQFKKGWFDTNMADLNYNNELLFDYVQQSYIYWAELTGLDGFRVDTYPYNDLEKASAMMRGIREEYPNMNMVGECWVKSVPEMAYYQSGNNNRDGFDSELTSVMDFMLKDYLEMAFVENEAWNTGLIRFYNHFAQDFALPNPSMVMNMLNNHDMSRYSNAVVRNPKIFKMGLAMLAVVRGYPQYYYGDEIMLEGTGGSYEDARHRFPGGWENDTVNAFVDTGRTDVENDLHNYLTNILQYRKTSKALTEGKMKHFLPHDGIYCLFRYTGDETIMVLVNKNEENKEVDLTRFDEMGVTGKKAKNIATGEIVTLEEKHTFEGQTVTILEIYK